MCRRLRSGAIPWTCAALMVTALESCTPPVKEGMSPCAAEATITLSAEAAEARLGEPLGVIMTVTNHSRRPLLVPIDAGCDKYRIECSWTGDGETRQKTKQWFGDPGHVYPPTRLLPGESATERHRLSYLAEPQREGECAFRVIMDSDGKAEDWAEPLGERIEITCWAGKAESNLLKITIKGPDTPEDVAALEALTLRKYSRQMRLDKWYLTLMRTADLSRVAREYPKSVYAKYCIHECGEVMLTGRFWEEAVERFSRVIKEHPPFPFTDNAKLGLAKAYLGYVLYKPSEGYRGKAVAVLEELLRSHPNGDAAPEARKLLAELKGAERDRKAVLAEKPPAIALGKGEAVRIVGPADLVPLMHDLAAPQPAPPKRRGHLGRCVLACAAIH